MFSFLIDFDLAGIVLLCHLIGDYIFQNYWMANNKTSDDKICAYHAATYTLAYALFMTWHPLVLLLIGVTHYVIDRYRLAKYVVWASNQNAPEKHRYSIDEMMFSGHKKDTEFPSSFFPFFILFIVDNTIHVLIQTIIASVIL